MRALSTKQGNEQRMKSDCKEEIILLCGQLHLQVASISPYSSKEYGEGEYVRKGKNNFKPPLKGILKGLNMNIKEDGRGVELYRGLIGTNQMY